VMQGGGKKEGNGLRLEKERAGGIRPQCDLQQFLSFCDIRRER
jgi:hypothetical protein